MQSATTLKSAPFTVRIPDGLRSEADAYAAGLGVSMNALMAVALREYLDHRATPMPAARSTALLSSATPIAPTGARPQTTRPRSASEPCPCGAKDLLSGYPIKWKHCCGRAA